MDNFIPLTQAAQTYRIPVQLLQELVRIGTIKAAQIDGDVYLSEADMIDQTLPKTERPEYKKYASLAGIEISLNVAADKYTVNKQTLSRWVAKGYIAILRRDGQKVFLDEADVAYCAEVAKARPGAGKWLFRDDGTPYKPNSK